MRKIKFIIPLLILFLTIGFAAVNFSLSINGDTEITGNLDNFNVYFSRTLVNGEENNSIVSSKTQLDFSGIIDKVGNTYTIEYDVTNASTLFDAEVIVKCSPSSEYLLVQNTFDTSNLSALETRTGTLLLKKLKTISNDSSIYKTITCEIVATPVERESEVTGSIPEPLNPVLIGREVAIGEEKFNVISSTEDTVTMLAQGSIDGQIFSDESGWEYAPGPKEIDIWEWSPYISDLVDEYVNYLKTEYDVDVTGNLITLKELVDLGCTASSDYTYGDLNTCADSVYSDWLIDDGVMGYWTRSAYPEDSNQIWLVDEWGDLIIDNYDMYLYGVRPTITISRELYTKLISSSLITYKVGREISIGDEKFNVISDNGLTVTMLAKYNLGTDYRQSTKQNDISFSDSRDWTYINSPVDAIIQDNDGQVKTYVNEYVTYLKSLTSDNTLVGNLITLRELGDLGCKVSSDYSYSESGSCVDSTFKNWLINNQSWWTRSVRTDQDYQLWWMYENGNLHGDNEYNIGLGGVRPTITISKETLNYLESLGNYEVGQEVSIGEEKFNVISDNGTTISMLAQYNIGNDNKQNNSLYSSVMFANYDGWEYTPGPKDIDISSLSSPAKDLLNNYLVYLKSELNNDNIQGDFISLKQLKSLNCTVGEEYEDIDNATCANSVYKDWLVNGQDWWTKSAYPGNQSGVWFSYGSGHLSNYFYYDTYGVRPVITIPKSAL